jgi:hypothetical protein
MTVWSRRPASSWARRRGPVPRQIDAENADLARERRELAETPEAELEELTQIYAARGLDRDLAAAQVRPSLRRAIHWPPMPGTNWASPDRGRAGGPSSAGVRGRSPDTASRAYGVGIVSPLITVANHQKGASMCEGRIGTLSDWGTIHRRTCWKLFRRIDHDANICKRPVSPREANFTETIPGELCV